MAGTEPYEPDEQDQSEVFDEDNFDDSPPGSDTSEFRTLEELPEVLDVTSAAGDEADEDLDDLDPDELDAELAADGVEPDADPLYGVEDPTLEVSDADGDGPSSGSEIELVYTGLMRDVKGAQGSAAHWESRRLADDDLDALGYQGQEPTE